MIGGLPGKRQIGVCTSLLSLRTSAHAGVAIPRLEGKCSENYPEKWESLRFLVVIITWFLSTGGLPHQSADWFAMTAFLVRTFKHQFIDVDRFAAGAVFCTAGLSK